jgi:hypothetical protein
VEAALRPREMAHKVAALERLECTSAALAQSRAALVDQLGSALADVSEMMRWMPTRTCCSLPAVDHFTTALTQQVVDGAARSSLPPTAAAATDQLRPLVALMCALCQTQRYSVYSDTHMLESLLVLRRQSASASTSSRSAAWLLPWRSAGLTASRRLPSTA